MAWFVAIPIPNLLVDLISVAASVFISLCISHLDWDDAYQKPKKHLIPVTSKTGGPNLVNKPILNLKKGLVGSKEATKPTMNGRWEPSTMSTWSHPIPPLKSFAGKMVQMVWLTPLMGAITSPMKLKSLCMKFPKVAPLCEKQSMFYIIYETPNNT